MARVTFREDKSVKELAEQVIAKHKDLEDCKDASIIYLVRISDKCQHLGKCSRATDKWKHLTKADYVCEVWEPFWRNFPESREALLYHELRHIRKKIKKNKDGELDVKWSLAKHEIEMFLDEVKLFGFWNEALKQLEVTIKNKEA